jgi:hypothetical protein
MTRSAISTRTVTFYDSTNLSDLPRRTRRLFAYIDGPEENYRAARRKWPKRIIVPITIGVGGGELAAAIIDSEAGDADPDTTAAWCRVKLAHGDIPTVYRSAALWEPVDEAIAALGLHYGIGSGCVQRFIADYDGDPVIPRGDVAKQYLGSPNGGSPGHYDVTVALPHVPGWGMGGPLSRRHRRYVRSLNAAWQVRTTPLTDHVDRLTVSTLIGRGSHLLDLQ